MPIYEYKCPICELKHETIRSWSDNILCPECGVQMERIPSVTAKRRDMTVAGGKKRKS
jgi:putative FmdB family regulatory protein